jgi:dihydroorotase
MDILVRQAHIIDPSSPFHLQTIDILVQNGIITALGTINETADQVIAVKGLHASPGWTDIFSHFCDPGFESRETLETGSAAAAAGGYTDVFLLPNTAPVVHNKAGVEYIVQRSKNLPVTIHPIGAITRNNEGKELAEMYDMHQSGARAFSDGTNTIQSAGLLVKALQYLRAINKTIIQVPDDRTISASGLMNEGIVSTRLGLPGMPAIAEELMITRDIELAAYTDANIHITGVSTARGIELIRKAKANGVSVTCSVTPYHLCFSDEDLLQYDTHLKVNPPLRTKEDVAALKKAVEEGLVDCIAVHHLPHDVDHKIVEFEYAQFGMTGLETSFALVRSCLPGLNLEQIISLFSIQPRRIFDLPAATIALHQPAALTLFLPDEKWTVNDLSSRSRNTPLLGRELTGKPVGIINKDKLFLK